MDATSNTKTATLTVGNKTYDFPILSGTVGPDVIDIAKLYAQSGMFTYDPGFTSTGSCQSKITYIDGDAGVLEYRGYPIEQLAENGDFLETCYLLLYGNLPTKAQKEDFDSRVIHHTMVHEQMSRFFQGFRVWLIRVCAGARRRFRSSAAITPGANGSLGASERPQAGAPVEEDARRHCRRRHDATVRRREEPDEQVRDRRPRRDCDREEG